jgi:hypothetical protein
MKSLTSVMYMADYSDQFQPPGVGVGGFHLADFFSTNCPHTKAKLKMGNNYDTIQPKLPGN